MQLPKTVKMHKQFWGVWVSFRQSRSSSSLTCRHPVTWDIPLVSKQSIRIKYAARSINKSRRYVYPLCLSFLYSRAVVPVSLTRTLVFATQFLAARWEDSARTRALNRGIL